MKRNLFYLFALICSMSLFVACSDDDEDTSWKEIPQNEIPAGADGATLHVNGVQVAKGSVLMKVKNASEAVLTLKDVLPGYGEVSVPVELNQQPDGSFNFVGEANLTTPPSMITKENLTAMPIFKVTVEGNITKEGKAVVKAASVLSEQAQGGLTGAWNLVNTLHVDGNGLLETAPLWVEWTAKDAGKQNMMGAATMLRTFFGTGVIYNLLGNVTFGEDGNLTANYNNTEDLEMETVMGYMGGMNQDETTGIATLKKVHNNWADSPKNLMYWYALNDRIFLVPNIVAIMNEAGEDTGDQASGMEELIGMLGKYNIDVTALLPTIQRWMTVGIPLKYKLADGVLKLYVDKELAAPVMEALLPALDVLQVQLDKMMSEPGEMDTATYMMVKMLFDMIGIKSLTDIGTIWKENTDQFEISLNLTR